MSSAQQIANSFVVDFFERLASNPATLGELYSQHAEVTISDFELGTTEARGAEVPSTVQQWAMIVQGSRLRVESVNAAPLYSGVNVFVTLSATGEMQQYFQITTTLEAYTGGFAVECYCIRHQVLSRIGALPAEQPAAATHDAEAATAVAPATNDGAASTTPAAAPEHAAAAEQAHKADEAAAATATAAGEATAKQNEAATANGNSAPTAAAAHSNDAATAAEVQQQQHSGNHGAAAKKASSGKSADATAAAAAPAASTTAAASSSSSKVKSWAKLASTAPAKHVDASKVIRVVAAPAHAATAAAATTTTTATAAPAAAASAAPATATTAAPAAHDERGRAHEGASAASRPLAAGAAKPLSQQPGQAQAPFVRRERRPVEPVGDRLIFNIDTTVTDDEVKAALGPLASSIVSLRNQSDRGRVFMDFAVNVKAYDQLRKLQPTLGSNKTRMMVYHQRPREGN